MMYRNSLEGLNPRHHHLPDELKEAILAGQPVSYEFYMRNRLIYSSKKLQVEYPCEICDAIHTTDFKHLNKRKTVEAAVCPKCVMKAVGRDAAWKQKNSEAQLKIQSLPEQRAKNAAGVSRFWAENPERLEKMRQNVIAAQQRPDVKAKYRERETWNGRGISGDYLSKWGWITFDSGYELAALLALELRADVLSVKRGPVIEYEFEDTKRQYFVDFAITFCDGVVWWMELKSGYVGKRVDRVDRLRAKLATALDLVRQGHADKMLLVNEKNAQEILGRKMPRGTDRKAIFQNNHDKIIFAREKDEEKYK